MTSILDAYPYPWGDDDARRLHRNLTVAFSVQDKAQNLAAVAGLDPYRLNINKNPDALWQDILNAAAEDGLTRQLAHQVSAELPETAPARGLLGRLLAEPPDPRARLRRGRADARLRMSGVLDHNAFVGGRTWELGELDAFRTGVGVRHLVLTGYAGMGKTALLAEWVRRLDARDDVDVVYYFISRQHGTAAEYRDLLASLLTQVGALSGAEPPRAADGIDDMETRWLQQLRPGSEVLRRRPMVVVIDGADEAEAKGWPLPHVLLPTVVADDVHMVVSARTMARRDWRHDLGLPEARPLSVGGLGESDVADLLAVAGAPDWVREPDAVATLMKRTGGDPFYLRFLVDALTGRGGKRITSLAGLNAVPDRLETYLEGIWGDAGGSATGRAQRAVLGYLCLTRGPITAEELAEIDPADELTVPAVGQVLTEVGRVVIGNPRRGGVALAHWRLRDIVAAAVLSRRDRAAREAALLAWCNGWHKHLYPYAVTYVAAHRIAAATGPEDLVKVVDLLVDADYQKLRVEELGDAAGLFADLDRLLRAEPGRPAPDAPTLVRAALAVGDARAEWSRPEKVFELADEGKADTAIRQLALLGSQPWQPWQPGARLVLAWVLARAGDDAARELLDPATYRSGVDSLEVLLAGRARHALGEVPEPQLRMSFWPFELPPSDRRQAVDAIERASGQPVSSYTDSGMRGPRGYTPDNESGAYLAEEDAPRLVAYARDQPGEGQPWLERYIEQQAGNPYALYRNRALWAVLAAVCCLPDAEQALRYAVQVTQAAFAPSPVRFSEFAHLAAVAGSGDRAAVEAARSAAVRSAAATAGLGELGDQWAHHVRRIVSHAEVAAVVLHDREASGPLLDTARSVPPGYAGYRAPAYLAMAETLAILGDPQGRRDALKQALRSAHNIQEPAFCAVMTARVTTLTEWWKADPLPELPELVDEFVENPEAARFRPRHRIGELFRYRDDDDHISIEHVRAVRDPQELAEALCVAPARLLDLNPRSDTATMLLPDPEFAPLVAAYLSARIAASGLDRPERIRLTAKLVPIAAVDPTALDLVLSRWICALGPGFEGLPALLGPLARRTTVEPSGGGQAGVT